MAQFACSLCHNSIEAIQYDLEKTVTLCSKTPLLTLLVSCSKERFVMNNYLICKKCYLLLNDLDSYKYKVKCIEEKLESYASQYYAETKDDQLKFLIDRDQECNICYKRVQSKDLMNHLKCHNSETNTLDTAFDLDEVSSMLELKPPLEEINLLGVEDIKGKNKFITGPFQSETNGDSQKAKEKDKTCLKPYSCTQCVKTWRTSAELKNHMSSHISERPFICEICGQAYKKQKALTIHVDMHNGINPFTCIYCKKSFTQKGALVRHIPIHTGDLPYQCDLCGKRFVHHSSFSVHKLSHSGEKTHKCEICGLMLMSGSHLKRHTRVHTGEKKFSCSTCGKKFAEKYNLAVHEKLHLGISKKKKYQCHSDTFYNKQVKLEEHVVNIHKKIEKSHNGENVKCE